MNSSNSYGFNIYWFVSSRNNYISFTSTSYMYNATSSINNNGTINGTSNATTLELFTYLSQSVWSNYINNKV